MFSNNIFNVYVMKLSNLIVFKINNEKTKVLFNYIQTVIDNPCSYNYNEYVRLSRDLKIAISGWGTDIDTIFKVFNQLNNQNDLYALDMAFGYNRLSFSPYSTTYTNLHFTLKQTLEDDLNEQETHTLLRNLEYKNIHIDKLC